MPQLIKLEELEEGQIFAETLVNKYGQTLVKKGTPISVNSHKRILKMWGINEVNIFKDEFESTANPEENENREKIENELMEKIGWEIENPNEKFLIDIVVISIIEKGYNE